ncbi:EAL domain-containing protein [Bacillaceae bacterium S4-13-58]
MSRSISLPIDQWLLDHLHDALLFVDHEGMIVKANEAAHSLIGHYELSRHSVFDYFDFEILKEKKESHLLMEIRDGSKRYFQIKCLQFEQDHLYCLLLHPLSVQANVEKLKTYIKKINYPSEGLVLFHNGLIIDCDSAFSNMLGYEARDLLKKPLLELIDETSYAISMEEDKDCFEDTYNLIGKTKDGNILHIEGIVFPYPNFDEKLKVAVVRDVTERVNQEKVIEYITYYDDLTGLPNRTLFDLTLKDAIEFAKKQQEQMAVYFVDVDYFKQINDTLGYTVGDDLLRECTERLKKLIDGNQFLARMSGDEFIILQRELKDIKETEKFAEKLIQSFHTPIQIGDYEIFTSISIGISIYPENGYDANDLIKHADSAMYVVKEKNRSHYKLFESSISENFRARLTMENELRRAMRENQFEIHYQPQKEIESGRVVGLEALIRWNHPVRGLVSPGSFIPIAEKTGLIVELGYWVLREACRQNKEWQNQGYEPFVVSVNLSAKQFHSKNLVQKVEEILKETGLHPKYLELEITESIAMTNEDKIIFTLQGLRKLGVHVSIDDFGTGYSSLKYLSQFPISKLKIDKVFIHENRERNQAIIKSIIHMSHSLNMKVIAEGVETEEQLIFLQKEKCDEIQGFYYSKPLHPKNLATFLKMA